MLSSLSLSCRTPDRVSQHTLKPPTGPFANAELNATARSSSSRGLVSCSRLGTTNSPLDPGKSLLYSHLVRTTSTLNSNTHLESTQAQMLRKGNSLLLLVLSVNLLYSLVYPTKVTELLYIKDQARFFPPPTHTFAGQLNQPRWVFTGGRI